MCCWLQVVYKVGRTMFETNSLPKHLVEHCNSMDEVWVPTEFNRCGFDTLFMDDSAFPVLHQHFHMHWKVRPQQQGV
jgi:hypothetical protein